jgi:heme-degrading monooxygenase HmoA
MIACIIEFRVRPGMEARHQEVLQPLLDKIDGEDGFLGKETYAHIRRPDELLTVSWWRDRDALDRWMRDPDHLVAIKAGKSAIFSDYRIRLAEVTDDKNWTAPAAKT